MADEQKEVKLTGGVFAEEEAAIAASQALVEEALSTPEEEPEEPSEDAPEEPEVEAEPVEEPEEPAEESPATLSALIGLIGDLRKEISDLKSGTPPKEEPVADPVAAIPQVTPKEIAVSLTDDDFEALTQDKDSASRVLATLVNKSNKQLASQIVESVYQSLPQIVTPLIARMQAGYSAAETFRRDPKNADLINHKNPRVQQLLVDEGNRLGREHPTWEPSRVFDEAANSVRSLISAATSKVDEPAKPKPPIKPKGGGSRGGDAKPQLTELQKELKEAGWRPAFK